jgi:ubiquinol-cytochrome c reductase cytochrome b subunit
MKRIIKYDSLLSLANKYIYDGALSANINYFYNLGSLLGLILILQILSGIFLSFNYIPSIDLAFKSIEYIEREVHYGYLIRYIHMNGASFFFIIVYLHMVRSFLYGSYSLNSGRNYTWNIGVIIFLLMILTAFIGYSLVYGQMSYWAIAVITNLLSVIPYLGKDIIEYIYGGFNIGGPTLGRFYSLHYLLPFIILALSIAHLITLHDKIGTNPLGLVTAYDKTNINYSFLNFHPYFTIKDLLGLLIFLIFFIIIIFFFPRYFEFGHTDNYLPADPMVTPNHIVPEFYLLAFYAILRSIPNKIIGVLSLLSAILVLLIIPNLHKHILNTTKFRPIYKIFLYLFFINFLLLIFIGQELVAEPYVFLGQIFTIYYFFFILIIIPISSFIEFFLFYSLQTKTNL